MNHLADRVRMHSDDVRRLTAGFSEEQLSRHLKEGQWSLKQVIAHLARCQDLFFGRVRRMLDEDTPAITPYDQENDPEFDRLCEQSGAEIIAGFLAPRAGMADLLDALTVEQWARHGKHPEFHAMSVAFQIEYMIHHEGNHLYQLIRRGQSL